MSDFPSNMKLALRDDDFVMDLQRSFAEKDVVMLYKLNNWRFILTVQPETMLGYGSEAYFVSRAGAEKMHFAQMDFQAGSFRSTSMLGHLDWDAGAKELSSKICNDAPPHGCTRAIYRYVGSTFNLMRIEYSQIGSPQWTPVWRAAPIERTPVENH